MKKIFIIPLIFIFAIYGIGTILLVLALLKALYSGIHPHTIPRIILCIMSILGMVLFTIQETRSFHYYVAVCATGFILYFITVLIYVEFIEPKDLTIGWNRLDWVGLSISLLLGAFGSFLLLIGSGLGWYFQRLYKRTKDSSDFH